MKKKWILSYWMIWENILQNRTKHTDELMLHIHLVWNCFSFRVLIHFYQTNKHI